MEIHRQNPSWKFPRGWRLRSSRGFPFLAGLLVLLWAVAAALAHDPGLSIVTARLDSDRLDVQLGISPTDFNLAMHALAPGDGQKPMDARGQRELSAGALTVRFDEREVSPDEVSCRFDGEDSANVHLVFRRAPGSKLTVRCSWLSVLPPGHRQFISIRDAGGAVLLEQLLGLGADSVTISLAAAEAPKLNSFADFLVLGVKHIWTGYDHLLFLFGLLIVTRNFGSSVKIITCFTVAHSLTLAVATLSLVQIPSRIVEPLIAASIVYVGLENLWRGDDPKGRWLLTFGFGLIHGFGFASVLRELGVGANGGRITVPLLSFNLGVELGQIAIAAMVLPVIWKLRARPVFIKRWVPACSVAVALLGGYWFIERVWFN